MAGTASDIVTNGDGPAAEPAACAPGRPAPGDGLHDGPAAAVALHGRVAELEALVRKQEQDFGVQRARFKELYMRIEAALQQARAENEAQARERDEALERCRTLREDCERASSELASLQEAVQLSEQSRREEDARARSAYENEIMSLRSVLQAGMRSSVPDDASFARTAAGHETTAQRGAVAPTQPAKTRATGAAAPSAGATTKDDEAGAGERSMKSLDRQARRAAKETEMLRAVVVPMEQEMADLRRQLAHAEAGRQSAQSALEAERRQAEQREAVLGARAEEASQLLAREREQRAVAALEISALRARLVALQQDGLAASGTESDTGVAGDGAEASAAAEDSLPTTVEALQETLRAERKRYRRWQQAWQRASTSFLDDKAFLESQLEALSGELQMHQPARHAPQQPMDAVDEPLLLTTVPPAGRLPAPQRPAIAEPVTSSLTDADAGSVDVAAERARHTELEQQVLEAHALAEKYRVERDQLDRGQLALTAELQRQLDAAVRAQSEWDALVAALQRDMSSCRTELQEQLDASQRHAASLADSLRHEEVARARAEGQLSQLRGDVQGP